MGDYIRPKRILRENNALTTDLLNDQILPAAQAVSALNCHNISENAISKSMIAEEAVYSMEYAEVTAETVKCGDTEAAHSYPSVPIGTSGFVQVPNNGSWDRCTDSEVTIQSASDVLIVIASGQYIWHEFGVGSKNHLMDKTRGCGVMLSLIVGDLQYAVSGFSDPLYCPAMPLRATVQYSTTTPTKLPGPIGEFQSPCGACGPDMFPVFMAAIVPVTPGQQTCCIAAKRVNTGEEIDFKENDIVEITQQQVFVLRVPWRAFATGDADGVAVAPFESEDVLSAAAVGTNRIDKLRDKLNAVTSGMLGRGALLSDHLPMALHSANESHQGTVGTNTTVDMATYQYSTYSDTASTNWYLSTDPSEITLADTDTVGILVVGTVNIRGIQAGDVADGYIAIALFHREPSGSYTKIKASERYVNSFGYVNSAVYWSEEVAVQVMAFVDYRTVAPVDGTHSFKVGVTMGSMSTFSGVFTGKECKIGVMTVDAVALERWG